MLKRSVVPLLASNQFLTYANCEIFPGHLSYSSKPGLGTRFCAGAIAGRKNKRKMIFRIIGYNLEGRKRYGRRESYRKSSGVRLACRQMDLNVPKGISFLLSGTI